MAKENKGDGMVVLFILSFLCMVVAVFLYMKREDTGFDEALGKISGQQTRVNGLEGEIRGFQTQLDDLKQIFLVSNDRLAKKMEALEMVVDAHKRKMIVPTTIKVELTNPVRLKTIQPFQVITREGPKAKLAKKPTQKIVDTTIDSADRMLIVKPNDAPLKKKNITSPSYHGQE